MGNDDNITNTLPFIIDASDIRYNARLVGDMCIMSDDVVVTSKSESDNISHRDTKCLHKWDVILSYIQMPKILSTENRQKVFYV